jgi:hypothetical protein
MPTRMYPVSDPSSRIITTHDASTVITDGIETRDRARVAPQHAPDGVSRDSVEGAEIAHNNFDCVLWCLPGRGDIGIRFIVRIAQIAVECS